MGLAKGEDPLTLFLILTNLLTVGIGLYGIRRNLRHEAWLKAVDPNLMGQDWIDDNLRTNRLMRYPYYAFICMGLIGVGWVVYLA